MKKLTKARKKKKTMSIKNGRRKNDSVKLKKEKNLKNYLK